MTDFTEQARGLVHDDNWLHGTTHRDTTNMIGVACAGCITAALTAAYEKGLEDAMRGVQNWEVQYQKIAVPWKHSPPGTGDTKMLPTRPSEVIRALKETTDE